MWYTVREQIICITQHNLYLGQAKFEQADHSGMKWTQSLDSDMI